MAFVPKNIPTVERVEKQIRCKKIAIETHLSRAQEMTLILNSCLWCRLGPDMCKNNLGHFLVLTEFERHMSRAAKEEERLGKSELLLEQLLSGFNFQLSSELSARLSELTLVSLPNRTKGLLDLERFPAGNRYYSDPELFEEKKKVIP